MPDNLPSMAEAVAARMQDQADKKRAKQREFDAKHFTPDPTIDKALKLRDGDPETYQQIFDFGDRYIHAKYAQARDAAAGVEETPNDDHPEETQ